MVDLRPALVDALVELRARSGGPPDALVFATATGGKQSPSNVRNRLLAGAVEHANARLAKADRPPLPEPLTPHSLRRTFISVLLTLGEPVPYVMAQAGHTDPKVTLGIYARVMRHSDDDRRQLRQLVDGEPLVSISLERDLAMEVKPRVDVVELPHEESARRTISAASVASSHCTVRCPSGFRTAPKAPLKRSRTPSRSPGSAAYASGPSSPNA